MIYIQIFKSLLNLGNKYGYLNLFKIIIFEILNFKFHKIYEYKFDKLQKSESELYIPSFFYALWLIKKKIDLQKKTLIDFGCGKGRVLRYFLKYTKDIVGIELNKDHKKYIPENLMNKVFWGDAYDDVFIDEIIRKNIEKELIIYFYHPFEEKRINEIISKFISKFDNLIIIFVGDINLDFENKKKSREIYLNGNLIKIFHTVN